MTSSLAQWELLLPSADIYDFCLLWCRHDKATPKISESLAFEDIMFYFCLTNSLLFVMIWWLEQWVLMELTSNILPFVYWKNSTNRGIEERTKHSHGLAQNKTDYSDQIGWCFIFVSAILSFNWFECEYFRNFNLWNHGNNLTITLGQQVRATRMRMSIPSRSSLQEGIFWLVYYIQYEQKKLLVMPSISFINGSDKIFFNDFKTE